MTNAAERSEAIRTVALCKNYGHRPALIDMDLRVGVGEVFGFLGPNGAGKSTTIRVLLDLLRPTSGDVTMLGLRPRQDGPALRRRIGYLPGEFVIYGRQSVREALTGLARLRGGVAPQRIAELAERFDLDLSRTFRELSKGNRQKVGLLQAFMHDPELLILDEPTDGLDPLLRQRFVELVNEVRADGRTVFLSSHILSEVQATADRVGMIRGGRLVATDSVESLRERAVRSVEIQFEEEVDAAEFGRLPNVLAVSVTVEGEVWVLRCQLAGGADGLVKAAARHPVRTLRVDEPDLEDVFVTLYREADDGDR
ncbi:ABC transporter ATP-binding protein [Jatrophihabitans sp. GAS493]|uniref:ABC transporter ATP-binding protein n=1 Tax=Jatrophihabitans sp. GAS493 TaxID=1907575 RepID=UPI0018D4E1AA|nr:ABC transporter ATP-binding protein [Jatrophihabitans sp. GAS493]